MLGGAGGNVPSRANVVPALAVSGPGRLVVSICSNSSVCSQPSPEIGTRWITGGPGYLGRSRAGRTSVSSKPFGLPLVLGLADLFEITVAQPTNEKLVQMVVAPTETPGLSR